MTTDTNRDATLWRLVLGIRLLSVAYSGVLASGVMLVVLSWCARKRGLLFASVPIRRCSDCGVPLRARLGFAVHGVLLRARPSFADRGVPLLVLSDFA